RPARRPSVRGPDLQPAARIEPFEACAVDPKSGRALVLTQHRFLKVYSYPDFRFQKSFWLGTRAHHAVLDAERGLLYVAVYDLHKQKFMNNIQSRVGDLHVYDVKDVLASKEESHALKPATVIPLSAEIARLTITPDNRWVYYLDTKGARLGRIDAATRKPE